MTSMRNNNLREFLLELVQRKVPGISQELYIIFVDATIEAVESGFSEHFAYDGHLKLNNALEQAEYRKFLEDKITPRLDELNKEMAAFKGSRP